MAVTAQMVKELREITQAGMLDCQKALKATDGDMEKAISFLREKGLADAAKKASRVAAEGSVEVLISEDSKTGVIVEINSETDFVAKNVEFKNFVSQVCMHLINSSADNVDKLFEEKWVSDDSITVKDALSQKVAVIGENIKIRRFQKYKVQDDSFFVKYIHAGGKVGVLLEIQTTKKSDEIIKAAKDIAMQIAAMSPRFVNVDEVPTEYLDKEKEILVTQVSNEGKPQNIVDKIVEGRLKKYIKEICLNDQAFIKDDGDLTVSQYLDKIAKNDDAKACVKRFVRFATGEGIEKKEENFADEVNKVIKN